MSKKTCTLLQIKLATRLNEQAAKFEQLYMTRRSEEPGAGSNKQKIGLAAKQPLNLSRPVMTKLWQNW